jgi:hypothetical protein
MIIGVNREAMSLDSQGDTYSFEISLKLFHRDSAEFFKA